jgi:hypothetical protein
MHAVGARLAGAGPTTGPALLASLAAARRGREPPAGLGVAAPRLCAPRLQQLRHNGRVSPWTERKHA